MRRRTALFAVLAVFAAMFTAGGPVAAQTEGESTNRERGDRLGGPVRGFELRDLDETVQVFIQLDAEPVSRLAAQGATPAAQRAQKARVVAQHDIMRARLGDMIVEERSALSVGANGLRAVVRVRDIPTIRAIDGVKSVAQVARYRPLNETSVPWIGGTEAADAGFTGDGVSIAIIDTGIDYTHASMGGSGDPEDYADIDPSTDAPDFNDKVVLGHDFAGPTYDASDPDLDTPQPDDNPLDVNGHGTHVAGSAAGLGLGDDGPGMAPDSELWALKVFGDVTGSTDLVADAIEFALDPDTDGDTSDAVDVINMSLGSDYGHPDDPSAIASTNAADQGVVVVIASGNAGPLPYVTGSPGLADNTISVAASTDDGVELLGISVDEPAEIAGEYEAAEGEFGPLDPDVTGEVAIADPLDACTAITSDVDGKIALIQRGTCEFTVKVRNAEDAGAIAALVFNNTDGPPAGMAHNGTEPQPTIPAVMVSLDDGILIHDTAESETVVVTLSDDILIPRPDLADTMADFTSRGPGFNSVFKPDVSAPGFSIFSADVGSGDGGALSSGTSMATPHVAGAAAQLLEQYPDFTPEKTKVALMNSARPAEGDVSISTQGTGVVQIDRAVLDAEGFASPGGISFGRLNPTAAGSSTESISVERYTNEGSATYDVVLITNQAPPGASFSLSTDEVTVVEGTPGSVDVTLTVDPEAMDSDDGFLSQTEVDGWVRFTNQDDADDTMVVGLMAVIDPASTVTVSGGEDVVDLSNGGPGDGFADGFTMLGTGSGAMLALGYRTGTADDGDGPYRTIDFGIALEQWSGPSANEVDVFLDVDQDGSDDFVLVAADLGLLTGAADPSGDLVTALIDLNSGEGTLLYFAIVDFNDEVAILPADLTGFFGFAPDDIAAFDVWVAAFDQTGLVEVSDVMTVDLESEVTSADGLSVVLASGEDAQVPTEGAGEMLWLYQNNAVGDQVELTTVTTTEEPPPPPPPPGVPEFDDVPTGHLFHQEITWLATVGITRGCNPPANTLFCPDGEVTRGQMAAFLNRALNLSATAEDFFTDDDGNVFEHDINELAAAGITRGCNPPANDQFCPERTLTRAEMATFMVRGYELTDGAGDDLFVDDDDNIHESAIDILGTAGVTRGCNPPVNDQFCPDRTIIRGEMAAFLYRAYNATGLGGGSS